MGDEEMKEWKKSTFCLILANGFLWGCTADWSMLSMVFSWFSYHIKCFMKQLKMWQPEAKLIFPKPLGENLAVV